MKSLYSDFENSKFQMLILNLVSLGNINNSVTQMSQNRFLELFRTANLLHWYENNVITECNSIVVEVISRYG